MSNNANLLHKTKYRFITLTFCVMPSFVIILYFVNVFIQHRFVFDIAIFTIFIFFSFSVSLLLYSVFYRIAKVFDDVTGATDPELMSSIKRYNLKQLLILLDLIDQKNRSFEKTAIIEKVSKHLQFQPYNYDNLYVNENAFVIRSNGEKYKVKLSKHFLFSTYDDYYLSSFVIFLKNITSVKIIKRKEHSKTDFIRIWHGRYFYKRCLTVASDDPEKFLKDINKLIDEE